MNGMRKFWPVLLVALLAGCGKSNQQASASSGSAAPAKPPTGKALQAEAELSTLNMAIGLYQNNTGSLPQQLSDLVKNPGVSGWKGPYLKDVPKDPWGHPYIYHPSGSSYKVLSAGPDGQEGTADDVGGGE